MLSRAFEMIDSNTQRTGSRSSRFRERLAGRQPVVAAELRPPRRSLVGVHAMEAWIDVYHTIHRLTQHDTIVFLTDSAVGSDEEESLSHLSKNLHRRASRESIVPILTLKHELDYCLRFAERVRRERFPALVVVGGDKHDGIPRCLPHAYVLRERLRKEQPGLLLGGWANPYRDPASQAELIARHRDGIDFVLTQVLTHHDLPPVERFVRELSRCGVDVPLFAGVFFYRSARSATLDLLSQFIPVPRVELERDFGERRMTAEEIASETMRRLHEIGITRFYLSNLETHRAHRRVQRIQELWRSR